LFVEVQLSWPRYRVRMVISMTGRGMKIARANEVAYKGENSGAAPRIDHGDPIPRASRDSWPFCACITGMDFGKWNGGDIRREPRSPRCPCHHLRRPQLQPTAISSPSIMSRMCCCMLRPILAPSGQDQAFRGKVRVNVPWGRGISMHPLQRAERIGSKALSGLACNGGREGSAACVSSYIRRHSTSFGFWFWDTETNGGWCERALGHVRGQRGR
jgi:hypothetical protein